MPPSGAVAGRTKASDREVTTGKNFKHPMALGGVQRLTAQYRSVGWRENKGKSERGRGRGEGEEGEGSENREKKNRGRGAYRGRPIRSNKTKIN